MSTQKRRASVVRWITQVGKNNGLGNRFTEMIGVALRLVKGGADRTDIYGVDALSGATLTSRGVDNLVKFWLSDTGFKPFLDNVRQGRI